MSGMRDLALLSQMGPAFEALDPFVFSPLFATSTGPHNAVEQRVKQRAMHLDVSETNDKIDVKADIPGAKKENIKLDLDGDTLQISVDNQEQKEENKSEGGVTWHRSERSSFFVKRTLRLPEHADGENINASYTDGVLHVVIPKKPVEEKKRSISVA